MHQDSFDSVGKVLWRFRLRTVAIGKLTAAYLFVEAGYGGGFASFGLIANNTARSGGSCHWFDGVQQVRNALRLFLFLSTDFLKDRPRIVI